MSRVGKFTWCYTRHKGEHPYLSFYVGTSPAGPRFGGTMYNAELFDDRAAAEGARNAWPLETRPLCSLVVFTSEHAIGLARTEEDFVRQVLVQTKHGSDGQGGRGPCRLNCIKCEAEARLVMLRTEALRNS